LPVYLDICNQYSMAMFYAASNFPFINKSLSLEQAEYLILNTGNRVVISRAFLKKRKLSCSSQMYKWSWLNRWDLSGSILEQGVEMIVRW